MKLQIHALLMVLAAMLMVGCTENNNSEPVVRQSDNLLVYEDPDRGVTCYRVYGYEGISCLKTKPSAEEQIIQKQLESAFGIEE